MKSLKLGSQGGLRAERPGRFLFDYLAALFFRPTKGNPGIADHLRPSDEKEFWETDRQTALKSISLIEFKLTDWFPRVPGVFWSNRAQMARKMVWSWEPKFNPVLGKYYSPLGKANLIEDGGIGTVRLLPKIIDGTRCWFGTALKGNACHAGIPLVIPDKVLQSASAPWGEIVNIEGQVRFLQDTGLKDMAKFIHHAPPFIIFVEDLYAVEQQRQKDQILIAPVALFGGAGDNDQELEFNPNYTYVSCVAGSKSGIEAAGEWIEKYAELHQGRILTNFDEQYPILADAPLSYQRLVAQKFEQRVLKQYLPEINIESLKLSLTMNKIKVGGDAIININSTLTNVTQTIGGATGLDEKQKAQLSELVNTMKRDLAKLDSTHPEEAKAIATALEGAVENASRPAVIRKKNLLSLSVTGLKQAADLVKDIAPTVLTTAKKIAEFISDLSAN